MWAETARRLLPLLPIRVCDGSHGPTAAAAQQKAMLTTENRNLTPRKAFLDDMEAYIQKCQDDGDDILLFLDANEAMSKHRSGIRKLVTNCGLLDIHATLFPHDNCASHRQGTEKIDFALGTPRVLECVLRAGILPFDDAFTSDHRTMFLDISIDDFFLGLSADPVNNKLRSFTTKNNKHTQTFRSKVSTEWERRKITQKVKILSRISKLPTDEIRKAKLQEMWDKLDDELTTIFQVAEKGLRIPTRTTRAWSPALAKAGAEKRYWRLQLSHAIKGTTGGFPMQQKAKEANIEDDCAEDIPTLEGRYNRATVQYASMVDRSIILREDHIDTLIKNVEGRCDKESRQELRALQAQKRAEQQRGMFRKIRQTLKPFQTGAISRIMIPKTMAQEIKISQGQNPKEPTAITNNSPTLQSILETNYQVQTKSRRGVGNPYRQARAGDGNTPLLPGTLPAGKVYTVWVGPTLRATRNVWPI